MVQIYELSWFGLSLDHPDRADKGKTNQKLSLAGGNENVSST